MIFYTYFILLHQQWCTDKSKDEILDVAFWNTPYTKHLYVDMGSLFACRCTHKCQFSSIGRWVIMLNAEGYVSKQLKIQVVALLLVGAAGQWCFTEVNRMADWKIGASGHEWQSCPKVRHPKKDLDSPDHPNDHGEHPYPFKLREREHLSLGNYPPTCTQWIKWKIAQWSEVWEIADKNQGIRYY